MQFLRPARGLLDQHTVFDGHADLVAQRKQQSQFSGSKFPAVRRTQQQNSKRLLFRLKADRDEAAQILSKGELAEPANGFFLLQSRKRIVSQIAESKQPAEPRYQADEII